MPALTNQKLDNPTDLSPDSKAKTLPRNLEVWQGSSAVVEQGRHWSSALIWIISGLFGASLIWSFTARIDQTISVRGRLEPAGSVQDVDSPSAGVVSKVLVKEGEIVEANQPLLEVEAEGLASRREAIERNLRLLDLQARSLQTIIRSEGIPSRIGPLPALPFDSDPQFTAQLATARNQTNQIRSSLEQISGRLQSREESLRLQEQMAQDMEVVFKDGGIARNNYLNQLNQVQELRAEVSSLREERSRIIGETATQLNQVNQQMINFRSELVGLREVIRHRTIQAPISGTVFDLKVRPSSVINTSQVLLKIVPADLLQARVEITNNDIGFVKTGLPVTVGIDSFPAGEFGYIKGTLIRIGSDVIEPEQPGQQFSFPAIIKLNEQEVISGDKNLNLQSGMGLTANIKLRSRPAISILTDMFTRQLEGVKKFR
jgi:HlyD family secretion protein